jgi:molybdopterin-synthase adenylyltransferase
MRNSVHSTPVPEFSYGEFTRRNLGLVSEQEQAAIRDGAVFVCGTGGMGGACLQSLVRSGLTRLALADFDEFEVSNLNRQVFAFLSTVGKPKVAATCKLLFDINPDLDMTTYGRNWVDNIDFILRRYKVIVNSMDDLASSVFLYRKAKEHRATVIDAYLSPLPSVTVVRPEDPRPEERLRYPTIGIDWRDIKPAMQLECLAREAEYVLTHSSSFRHVDSDAAAGVLAGKCARMSFAPMVITTGNLMCFEVLNVILGRQAGTDYRGYFFNPWTVRVETPRSPLLAWLIVRRARRLLRTLSKPS